jgi:transcription elongation GreA/GreB family factor
MDKQLFIDLLLKTLEAEVSALRAAAQTAHDAATGEDMKSEGKYDTRAIEASYLAGAQARRVADLDSALALYRRMPVKQFTEDMPVKLGALVTLECGEVSARYFLGPQAGGLKLVYRGGPVIVVTPRSPIGSKLMGREVGDSFSVSAAGAAREYEIVGIA